MKFLKDQVIPTVVGIGVLIVIVAVIVAVIWLLVVILSFELIKAVVVFGLGIIAILWCARGLGRDVFKSIEEYRAIQRRKSTIDRIPVDS